MNPLNLTGPEFLRGYMLAFVLVAAASLALRWWLPRRARGFEPGREALDPYEIAWLRGRRAAVVRTALASLYQRKLIDVRDGVVASRAPGPPAGLPGIEGAVLRGLHPGEKPPIRDLERAVAEDCDRIEARLHHMGLAIGRDRRSLLVLVPVIGLDGLLLVGVAKLGVGLARHRPVVGLVVMLVITVVTLVRLVQSAPWRTSAASRLLAALGERHAALRTTVAAATLGHVEPQDVALAVALFGAAALMSGGLGPVASLYPEPKAWAASGGGGGDSTSDGGGGGCGGGGCGGGCGGCGS